MNHFFRLNHGTVGIARKLVSSKTILVLYRGGDVEIKEKI
jgi:hypothetical protein